MTVPETATAASPIEVTVAADKAGDRLDRVLAAAFDDLSRSRAQALVREGAVSLAGHPVVDPGRKVKVGEEYSVVLRAPIPCTVSSGR